MKKYKCGLLVIVAVMVLISTCSIGYMITNVFMHYGSTHKVDADWVNHYSSLSEMIASSDAIVFTRLSESIPEIRSDMVFTMQYLDVIEYIKGDNESNNTIQVLQTGGQLNGLTTSAFDDAPLFEKNEEMVLFLQKTSEGYYLVTGGYQGIGIFRNNHLVAKVSEDHACKEMVGLSMDEIRTLIVKSLPKTN